MSTDKYVKFKCRNCEVAYALEFDADEDEPSYCPFCGEELDNDLNTLTHNRDEEEEEEE